MDQEQNNVQPSATNSNQKKRHYREVGGPVQADSARKNSQKNESRSGGNRPPRNNQRKTASGQPQASAGSGQRQNRPKNRRTSSQQVVKQRPVERYDRGSKNETSGTNIDKAATIPERSNVPTQKQQRQDRNPRKDQPRSEHPRSGSYKNRRPARWVKKVRTEETVEDVRKDIERIEKEIWLEIASIHTIKLDF